MKKTPSHSYNLDDTEKRLEEQRNTSYLAVYLAFIFFFLTGFGLAVWVWC